MTPLRGIAAILVVMYHSNVFIYPMINENTTPFISLGWIWVDFFFVLSGFILSHVYNDPFQEQVTKKGYQKYMIARFARIYPLHIFTMIWAILIGIAILQTPRALGPWESFFQVIFNFKFVIPTSLLLLQGMHLHPMAPLNSPSWSLSTEWWMYLIFPFLVAPIQKFKDKHRPIMLLTLIALYVLLKYYLVPTFGRQMGNQMGTTINTITDFAFIRCIAGFMLGMLVYEYFRSDWNKSFFGSTETFLVLGFGLFASLYLGVNELLIVAFFPLIILSAAFNTGSVSKTLSKILWQRIGDWSFSIYMVHIPINYSFHWLAAKWGPFVPEGVFTRGAPNYAIGWLYFAAYLTVTLLIASQTYRWIEVPSRDYINQRFSNRAKKAPEKVPEEVLQIAPQEQVS